MTILAVVLDDDLRDLIRSMLERSDHQVIFAADEAEAVDRASSAQIDVLLIEVARRWTVARLRRRSACRRRDCRSSTSACWFDHPDFVGLRGESVLKAPFSRDELARAIDAAVADAA